MPISTPRGVTINMQVATQYQHYMCNAPLFAYATLEKMSGDFPA